MILASIFSIYFFPTFFYCKNHKNPAVGCDDGHLITKCVITRPFPLLPDGDTIPERLSVNVKIVI